MPDEPIPTADDAAAVREPLNSESFPIVGIGASAGGLESITHLLKALPGDTGMSFVVVQHLSPSRESALAAILSRTTSMPVTEVHDEPAVRPNHVYVIPPDRSMEIAGGVLRLTPREHPGSPRVVDHFFRTLAEDRRGQAIGVVLSGTGNDGTLGLEAIKGEGGITFAQDDSAQHDGMPHSAIASGCVDFVLPADQIAAELVRIAGHAYAAPEHSPSDHDGQPLLPRVLQLVQRATGVDFSGYKLNTLHRRIKRRMVLQRIDALADYVDYLQQHPAEVQALHDDVLIGVTGFFRNPEAYEALKEKVFPRLLEGRVDDEPVRIWTLGCATGQEAYSVAMAFAEFTQERGSRVALQVLATDLSAASVDVARAGIYPKDIATDVSPERLRRFFVQIDGRYRITKAIRDTCVFSRHNVLTDPPFSRLDLVTCRNLLIYLEPALQQKVVPNLHYALKPSGHLWLGTSETIGGFRTLFEPLDAKHKIYRRKPGTQAARIPLQQDTTPRAPFVPVAARVGSSPDLHREADRMLLSRFAPPSVLVSADLDILQYRGDTSPYLAPAPGTASLNLAKMLREGLLVGVRAAVLGAGKSGRPTREDDLRVKSHDGWRKVSVEVVPLKSGDGKDQSPHGDGFLVLFEELGSRAVSAPPPTSASSAAARPDTESDNARLTHELAATREYLQSVIDQQEGINEELQSSNEEIQSANEELQSINEELETSKEEIQSSNEELATVNDELNNRNAELSRVNNDLVNVFASVQMPIVLVGPDLRVRRYTASAEKQLNLLPGDIGRPLSHIRLGLLDLPDLDSLLGEVFDTVSDRELETRDNQGHRYLLRLRPYRTLDNRIDGVVLMLVDIELLKRAHEYTASIVATVREPLLVLDAELRVLTASQSFCDHFQVTRKTTEGRLLYDLGSGQWNIPRLRALLEEVLPRASEVRDYEVSHDFERIGRRIMQLNARRLLQTDDRGRELILLAIEDVTERKLGEASMAQLAAIVTSSKDAIISKDLDGLIRSWNQGAQDLFGYAADEVIGKPVTVLIPPDHLDEETEILRRIRLGEAIEHYETVRRRKDGTLLDISLTVSPIRDASGRVVGASKVARDITRQRELSDQLRRSAAELAEIDIRKNEFLALLAHELRNPLAPIRSALQIIKLSGSADVQDVTQVMERQVAQLVRLVDDLLDVSRISRGKIELRKMPTDLVTVVRQAVEAAGPAYQAKGVELSVSLPEQPLNLDADSARLVQVLGNLLNNACKFTEEGNSVQLSLDRVGDEAVLRVRDNGIGIDAGSLPRIFEMFVQGDTSLERSSGGLGIGLSLVKNLVELHGGTVQGISAGTGRGSEFVVKLPIAAGPVSAATEPARADARSSAIGRRVLVADDNRDAAKSLAKLLRLLGHETRFAYDGLGALTLAEEFRPDVAFLDIGMPKLNGYDTARRLREQPWAQSIVLVALTGWGQEEARRESSRAGFDLHLVKPVDSDELQRVLDQLPQAGAPRGAGNQAARPSEDPR